MSLELSIVSLGSPCPFPFTTYLLLFFLIFTIVWQINTLLCNCCVAFAACYLIRSSNQN